MKKIIYHFTTICCLIFLIGIGKVNAQVLTCNDCPNGAIFENENCGNANNDNCANAIQISCGDAVCGQTWSDVSASGTYDKDYYKFTLSFDGDVTLHFIGQGSFDVSILDNCIDLNDLGILSGTAACVEDSITLTGLLAGDYLIRITPNAANDYLCADNILYNFRLNCTGQQVPCNLDAVISSNSACPGTGLGGTADLFVINGTAPYIVLWSNGSTDLSLTDLIDGEYFVTVTDDNGCSVTVSTIIDNTTCYPPDNLEVFDITPNKATIAWNGASCAYRYRLQIRVQGTTVWTTYNLAGSTTQKTIGNLIPNTTYQYRIKTVCTSDGSSISAFTNIATFTTIQSCDVPSNISVTNITATTARINWTIIAGIAQYRIHYRPVGSLSWTSVGASATSDHKIISGLSPSTEYEFQMRTKCNEFDVYSAYSSLFNFTTTSLRMEENSNPLNAVSVFPNPGTGLYTINLNSSKQESASVEIYNLLGKKLFETTWNLNAGFNKKAFDISSVSNGVYFIKVINTNVNTIQRIVKE